MEEYRFSTNTKSSGETQFAVSHQSQILETYQQNGVTIVCAFDEGNIESGPFAGVEGVGQHGYPYFRNRCFIMARAGTDEKKVAGMTSRMTRAKSANTTPVTRSTGMRISLPRSTMLLEVDTMSVADVEAHVENVKGIVNE